MRRFSIKISIALLIFLSIILYINRSQAATFSNVTEYNGKYIVKHGTMIKVTKEDDETIALDEQDVAKLTDTGEIRVEGVGYFKVKITKGNDSKELKFFSWNARLKNGQYWIYNNVKKSKKVGIVKGTTYFALSKTDKSKMFKIESHLFADGGKLKYGSTLDGRYITSYLKKNDGSSSRYYKYAFKSDLEPAVDVESVKLNKNSIEIEGFSSVDPLTATVLPNDATYKKLVWTSSNENVVTVSDGKIKVKGVGTAEIKAESSNGKSDICSVTVKPVEPESIKIVGYSNNTTEIIALNDARTFSVKILPSNATNTNFNVKSESEQIAKVSKGEDKKFIIEGKQEGETNIIVSTDNGKTAEMKIQVKLIEVTNISFDKSSLNIDVGQSEKLNVKIEPEIVSFRSVIFKSEDSKIAKIDSEGNVTGVSVGSTVVTATSKNGKVARCNVTVKETFVKNIKLNPTSMNLNDGESKTIAVTLEPNNVTYKDITFESSDSSIVTVDNNGKVTAKSGGKATITVKSAHGDANGKIVQAQCEVSVKSSIKYDSRVNYKGKLSGTTYIHVKTSGAMSAGKQGPDQCLQYAMKYASKILSTQKKNKGVSYTGSRRLGSTDLQRALYIMAKEIEKGRPTVIRINGRGGVPRYTKNGIKYYSRHYVTCVGVRADADLNNLKETDFYVLDPGGAYGHVLKKGYMLKTEHNSGHLADAKKYPGYQIYVYADAKKEGYVTGEDGYSAGKVVYRYPKKK